MTKEEPGAEQILYKLTNQKRRTHGNFEWPEPGGDWVIMDGTGALCGPGWLHCYTSPHLAVLLNTIHARIPDPIGWALEWRGRRWDDHGLKVGVTEARLLHQIELPVYSIQQRIAFSIYCAQAVHPSKSAWNTWATKWLSGQDRTIGAAWKTSQAAAEAAAWAAAQTPEQAVAWAAWRAAQAAARAAAEAAVWAAEWTAARAAEAAAEAAEAAVLFINLHTLAVKALDKEVAE